MSGITTNRGYYGHSGYGGFESANEFDKSITLWHADIHNLENDLNSKDRIEARILDLYRNNDLMRGMVEKMVECVVGDHVKLNALPDYEALGVSRNEALDWSKMVERQFHRYADSPENWITADRSMDFTQLMRQIARSRIFTGEAFVSREWRQARLGFSTCYQHISSNRVKNPSNSKTSGRIFHGIEFDRFNAAVAYHIEVARLNQRRSFGLKQTRRYSKFNSFNWLQLYHVYEPIIPEYPRGISRLASVLKKMKQLDRYNEADLDKNIIAASYVLAITSDEDPEGLADMLSGASAHQTDSQFAAAGQHESLPKHIKDKRDEILSEIKDRVVKLTGGKMMHLFKGEEAKILQAPNASQTSQDYTRGVARSITSGAGIAYELATGDMQGLSFSGGQMALGMHEHSANIERRLYVHKMAKLLYRSWLDEALDKSGRGEFPNIPLLGDKPYFPNREEYSRCEFSGVKRVHLDPVKNANQGRINLGNGTISRTQIANEAGRDIETITIERAQEARTILDAIQSVADELDITLNDAAKLKILTDVVATSSVEVPEFAPEEMMEAINAE